MIYLDEVANEIRGAVPEGALPADDNRDLFRLYAVLLLSKGEAVTREDVHNAWVAWMLSNGKQHESLIPFTELDPPTQAEDGPFVQAIREVANARRERSSHGP